MLPPVRSDRSSTWIAGSSPVMTGGGVAPAVHPALYIEEHGLPAALHVNVEAVDGDAVALFTCSDQRLTALCRHREQHRIARVRGFLVGKVDAGVEVAQEPAHEDDDVDVRRLAVIRRAGFPSIETQEIGKASGR